MLPDEEGVGHVIVALLVGDPAVCVCLFGRVEVCVCACVCTHVKSVYNGC